LGEVYKTIRNAFVGTATPYYVESNKDGYFYLESNNIKDGVINRIKEIFINEEFYLSQRDKWLYEGDLVMVQSGHVGHTAVIPKELNETAAHALIIFQNQSKPTDPHFLNYELQTTNSKKMLDNITIGNTIKHILASDMKEFKVSLPNKIEQTAIGNFFRTLDNTILLYKRKLDSLKQLKKAYLQQMFPQEGETVPKVRFAGFKGDWEVYTLGELGSTYTGLSGKTKEDFGKGEAKYVTYLNILNNLLTNSEEMGAVEIDNKQNEVKYGDIFFTTSSETPEEVGMSSVWLHTLKNIYLNSFCFGFRPSRKVCPYYMAFMLRSPYVRVKIQLLAQGISRYNISKTKLMEIEINMPSLVEQTAIGNFFRNLDEQITTQQTKLNNLKLLKSAYLQKMFV